MRYLGAQILDVEAAVNALLSDAADGVVLGDALCQRRMFRHGKPGLVQAAVELSCIGGRALLQTPLYATDATCRETLDLAALLASLGMLDATIVQDVGLAALLRERLPEIPLVWGRWGRVRGGSVNADTLCFLHEIGVSAVECEVPGRTGAVHGLGLAVYGVVGRLSYATLSRLCYSCHLANTDEAACERRCVTVREELLTGGCSLEVHGRIVGERLDYPALENDFVQEDDPTEHVIIYASTIEDAVELCHRAAGSRPKEDS